MKLCYISALPTETLTKNDENPVSLGASPKSPKPNCSETLAAEKENKRTWGWWAQLADVRWSHLQTASLSSLPPRPSPRSLLPSHLQNYYTPSDRSFPCSHSLPSLPPFAFFLSLGVVLGLEPRALCLLAMSSLTNACSQGLVPVWIAAVVMDYCDCQFTLSFLAYHCSWAFFRFYVAICILCVIYLSCAFVHYSIKLFCFPTVEYISSHI